jgi:hypothetical protein
MTSAGGHTMEHHTKLLQFRAPESLSEAIDAAAKREFQTKSEYIRRSVVGSLMASGVSLMTERLA